MQAMQLTAPPVENCPGLQAPEHEATARAGVLPYRPAGQGVHEVEGLEEEYRPIGQGVHEVEELDEEYCPTGQGVHEVEAGVLYLPGAQAGHGMMKSV